LIPLLFGALLFFAQNKKHTAIGVLFFGICSLVFFRVFQPYAFLSLFDFHINTQFVENLKQLKDLDNPELLFPPGIQWINAPKFIFPLYNLVVYGMGIPLSILALLSFLYSLKDIVITKRLQPIRIGIAILLVSIASIFLYQGMQFAMPLRYFYPCYPFLCLLAGWGLHMLWEKVRYGYLVVTILLILCCVWPLLFLAIYSRPHSRITATNWIYTHIPPQSFILSEYWDDPLPLLFSAEQVGMYQTDQLHVFDRESKEKWEAIYLLLQKGDYIVLSSNRTYKPIQSHRDIYPATARYYDALFSGKLGFLNVYEGTSYPGIFGISLNDDSADETFTVYDHPKVLIYRKNGLITHDAFMQLVGL
jgi:hypothetical protein